MIRVRAVVSTFAALVMFRDQGASCKIVGISKNAVKLSAMWSSIALSFRNGVLTVCLRTGAGGKGEMDDRLDFFIPPPWAIAHSLIKTWAERPSPWFSKL
jgi:hypothetical protein